MNWIQGLTKAIQFIESNLTHEITVNDVANHVYASNAHYQRVFSLATGITIGDYIWNRRLTCYMSIFIPARSVCRRVQG